MTQAVNTPKIDDQNNAFAAKLAGAAGVAGAALAIQEQPANAQEADPVGDVTATATALQGIVGTGLVIGIALLGFGVGSRILRKMGRG